MWSNLEFSYSAGCLLLFSFVLLMIDTDLFFRVATSGAFFFAVFKVIERFIFLKNEVEVVRQIDEDGAKSLAYSFYNNYLRYILPTLHERIDVATQKANRNFNSLLDRRMSARRRISIWNNFIILIPISGIVEGYKLVTNADSRVVEFDHLEPVIRRVSGHPNREHNNTVYHVENTDIYCVCEFATPLLSLHRVSSHCGSMQDEILQRQITVFAEHLEGILKVHRHTMQVSCRLILYKDQCAKVADVLEKVKTSNDNLIIIQ